MGALFGGVETYFVELLIAFCMICDITCGDRVGSVSGGAVVGMVGTSVGILRILGLEEGSPKWTMSFGRGGLYKK